MPTINGTDYNYLFNPFTGCLQYVSSLSSLAPANATYVTLSTNATLTNERVLTGTSNQIIVTDNGAGSTVVLSTPQNIGTGSSPTFAGLTLSGMTAGSVLFAGVGGAVTQDNSNFFWDDTNNRLGIGTATPSLAISGGVTPLHIKGTHTSLLVEGTGAYAAVVVKSPGEADFILQHTGAISGQQAFYFNIKNGVYKLVTLTDDLSSVVADCFAVKYDGHMSLGFGTGNSTTQLGILSVGALATTDIPIVVRGLTSQTANLTEWRNSSSVVGAKVNADRAFSNNGPGSGSGNEYFGEGIALVQTAGSYNTAFGSMALHNFTTGSGNSAFGASAGFGITSGNFNMAIGDLALSSTTIGESNVAIGYTAGISNGNGTANTYLGGATDASSASLNFACAIGYSAVVSASSTMALGGTAFPVKVVINGTSATAQLDVNIESSSRIGLIVKGATSQSANLQEWRNSSSTVLTAISKDGYVYRGSDRFLHDYGTANLFLGSTAGNFTLTGNLNVGIGLGSLSALTTGNYNVGVGYNAMPALTSGTSDLSVGTGALGSVTTGSNNLGMGTNALVFITTANDNVGIGAAAGITIISGSGNTFIGSSADATASNIATSVAIGYGATVSASNTMVLGAVGANSVKVAINATSAIGQFDVTSNSASRIGVIVKGASSQSANLQEWRNDSAGILSSFGATGILTLGLASTQTGTINLNGTTSGTVTVNPAAAAGTWTLTLPTSGGTSGYVLKTDGSGVSSWVSTTSLKLPLPLFDHYADVNNSNTSETDLYSDTVAASQLANNGDKLLTNYQIVCNGAALATQQIKIYFGGTAIYDSGALSIGAATDNFTLEVVIIRESSSVVRCSVAVSSDFATLFPYSTYTRITGLTLSSTNILKVTGTAAGASGASNQITSKLGYVEFLPVA